MQFIIEVLLGASAAAGVSTIVASSMNRKSEKDLKEKLKELNKVEQRTSKKVILPEKKKPKKEVSDETKDRFRILEEFVQKPHYDFYSTEELRIVIKKIHNGYNYSFYYLDKPNHFIMMKFNKYQNEVNVEYIKDTLEQDKRRMHEVFEKLKEKIIQKHGYERILYGESNFNKRENCTDGVLKLAKEIEDDLTEEEFKGALEGELRSKIDRIKNIYQSMKVETKKENESKIMEALETIRDNIKEEEASIEKNKEVDLYEALKTIDNKERKIRANREKLKHLREL